MALPVREASGLREGAEHVLEDAVVAVVVGLSGGVDAHDGVELDRLAVFLLGRDVHGARGGAVVQRRDAGDREGLGAVEAQGRCGLTGGELARKILEIKPAMPVIMCTGHSDIVTEEHALARGIKKYVYKPLRGDELVNAIRDVLSDEAGVDSQQAA